MKYIKSLLSSLFILMLIVSCKQGPKAPDVSGIEVPLEVKRLDQDFFALDTNNLQPGIDKLKQEYGNFFTDYMQNILGLPVTADSNAAVQQQVQEALRMFLRDYRPIKDSANTLFGKDPAYIAEIRQALKYVKYYFPDYKTPAQLVSFIGPMDAYFDAPLGGYADILTQDAMGVGLQLHLGKDFSFYHSPMGQQLYPSYISARFTPEMIPVNCLKNIVDDLHPDLSKNKGLVEIMVEKGKRMYLLDLFLPKTPEHLKLGYTEKQLEGCKASEGSIWNFFVSNQLLFVSDVNQVKAYVGDGPFTQELGENSPGFIGLYVGKQIVKTYMEKYPETTPKQLLEMDPMKLYQESKYKPR